MTNTEATATDLNYFEALGRQAYLNGHHAAPALNAEVMATIGDAQVGDPIGIAVMKAYSSGFDAERDAECARILAED